MERRIGFMFSGQGAQQPGMGKDLYDGSLGARAIFDEADKVLGWKLSQVCFEGSVADLTSCATCQPAIYTMSHACLAALRERVPGLSPVICGGLSLGELSALSAAGVFSFADGLRLVARRGELMDVACRAVPGGMAAVLGGDLPVIRAACQAHGIDVANLNCPGQVVISGATEALSAAVSELTASGLRVIGLTVAGAYHSRLMSEAGRQFGEHLSGVAMSAPSCEIVQNVSGEVETVPETIRENLRKQVSSSVLWESCARHMMSRCDELVELGPGSVLCGFMKRIDRKYRSSAVNSLSSLAVLCSSWS